MREFKFRTYNKRFKKMLGIQSWYFNSEGYWITPDNLYKEHNEIMQYVGIKDKNGKEVYEGDVIQLDNYHGPRYEIEFCKGMFVWYERDSDSTVIPEWDRNHRFEIIGNIHENPELIVSLFVIG